MWLAGDLLEDLSFVQEDGVGGGHVEEEAGFVLLDAGDGELHSSGAGEDLRPPQGHQSSHTNTGARRAGDDGRAGSSKAGSSRAGSSRAGSSRAGRRRLTEGGMVEVDVGSGGRGGRGDQGRGLKPLLSGRDPH